MTKHDEHPDPRIAHVGEFFEIDDPEGIDETITTAVARCHESVHPRFEHATVTSEPVRRWVRELVANPRQRPSNVFRLGRANSLLMSGTTGTGKSHQAFGAIRALAVSGLVFDWRYAGSAELYADMRDFDRVDGGTVQQRFERYQQADLLVLDDLCTREGDLTAAQHEINLRLIEYRYAHKLATIVTTNVPFDDLPNKLGDRVTSRLVEMSIGVALTGEDRRHALKPQG